MPEVKGLLDGAPELAVLLYLRLAAKQFCKDTAVWRVLSGEQTVTALPPPDTPLELADLRHGAGFTLPDPAAGPYWILAVDDVLVNGESTRNRFEDRANPFAWDRLTGDLTVHRDVLPAITPFRLQLALVLEPARHAEQLPDFLVEEHSEGITSHAIANLKQMTGKEWSDPRGAAVYLARYEHRVSETRVRTARHGTTGKLQTPLFPFY